MTKPMPSPNGTNLEHLTIGSRVVAAYDAAGGLTDTDGNPMIDSGTASRIMSACGDKLSAGDVGVLVDALVKAALLSKEEAQNINDAMAGGSVDDPDDSMASDAAVMRRRHELVRQGRMNHADLYRPLPSQLSDKNIDQFYAKFPDARRIKHA